MALKEMKSNEEPLPGWCRTGIYIAPSGHGVSCYDRFSETFHAIGHVSWPPCSDLLCKLTDPQSRCSDLTLPPRVLQKAVFSIVPPNIDLNRHVSKMLRPTTAPRYPATILISLLQRLQAVLREQIAKRNN